MKTQSPAMAAARAAGTTTFAWFLRLEAKNGTVFCRSGLDIPLVINGEEYLPQDGITPSAISATADGAVQNSEVNGFLTDLGIDEPEILAGVWDGASAVLFEANWSDLSQGQLILQTGTLGNLNCARITYSGEIRGLSQALQQTTGRVYSPLCWAQLGDAECKVDVESMRVTSTVTAVTDRRTFSDSANIEANDWFGAGVVTFSGGDLDGFSMEVYSYDGAGNFQLVLPMPANIPVGQAYSVIPGCRKRHERGARNPLGVSDCVDKFNNVINFRGFPPSQFPGNNRILGLGSNASTSYNP